MNAYVEVDIHFLFGKTDKPFQEQGLLETVSAVPEAETDLALMNKILLETIRLRDRSIEE